MSWLQFNHRVWALSLLTLLSAPAWSVWEIATHSDTSTNVPTQVAYIENADGYSLEIYRDGVNAVRSRFSLSRKLDRFAERHCPTFQVDNRLLDNRSINGVPCITNQDWSEYVLGYIDNFQVQSAKLNALVNGRIITFRFLLDNGSYEETSFSLDGSKRATLTVIGGNTLITP